jgi:hypothetical protein
MLDTPQVEFDIPSGQVIGDGEHKTVPADLLVNGWHCTGCKFRVKFDKPRYFDRVVGQAMAHESACQECPKSC